MSASVCFCLLAVSHSASAGVRAGCTPQDDTFIGQGLEYRACDAVCVRLFLPMAQGSGSSNIVARGYTWQQGGGRNSRRQTHQKRYLAGCIHRDLRASSRVADAHATCPLIRPFGPWGRRPRKLHRPEPAAGPLGPLDSLGGSGLAPRGNQALQGGLKVVLIHNNVYYPSVSSELATRSVGSTLQSAQRIRRVGFWGREGGQVKDDGGDLRSPRWVKPGGRDSQIARPRIDSRIARWGTTKQTVRE